MEYIVGDFVKISLEDKEQVVTVRGYDLYIRRIFIVK